ncbi:MAG: D-alanine--D-alanine ligase [Actinobacteria bacterium]|nr:D-alanine--D-alanine ligase [Actinomycetota bacterium]
MERQVSFQSARRVRRSLEGQGLEVVPIDVRRDFVDRIREVSPAFAFISLHGRGGEDGTVQELLEIMKVPFTGSDARASSQCFDKHIFKQLISAAGLETPTWRSFTRGVFAEYGAMDLIPQLIAELELPLVIKPAREGSAFGVRVVEDQQGFNPALLGAFDYDDRILVERFVGGRELAVTITGEPDSAHIYPIVEVGSGESIYTFTAHYDVSKATLHVADLDPGERDRVEQAALTAYQITGCRDIARVDLILSESVPQILEINTIPGFGEAGPTPFAAQADGEGFDRLIARIIERTVRSR